MEELLDRTSLEASQALQELGFKADNPVGVWGWVGEAESWCYVSIDEYNFGETTTVNLMTNTINAYSAHTIILAINKIAKELSLGLDAGNLNKVLIFTGNDFAFRSYRVDYALIGTTLKDYKETNEIFDQNKDPLESLARGLIQMLAKKAGKLERIN